MFSKLQPHHHHHQQQQHHHHHHHSHHNHPYTTQYQQQQQQQQVTSTTSEEADDTATTTAAAAATNPHPDGASIEVVRRPRGRPPGSKNKPKPPVIITRDTDPAMSPYILEVPGGNDVVDAIARFCRRKAMGLCVLTGSGTVANVTLRQPSTTPGATVTFHGRFDILSVTATFLPPSGPSPAMPNGFTISLAGPQGQIVGGLVAGALVAAGTVYIVAASFNNPSYHRLPAPDEDSGRDGAGGESPAGSAGGGESGGHAPSSATEMGMFGVHVAPPDVVWAPTARQPPPPPPSGY